jgi:hypothetical protein
MLTAVERDRIRDQAYIPEHLVDYVTAISGAEPCLAGAYLYYKQGGTTIFVGYPLGEPFTMTEMETRLKPVLRECKPRLLSLVGPAPPPSVGTWSRGGSDHYFRLDLQGFAMPPKVRNMVMRASKVLFMSREKKWNNEHGELVAEFLESRSVDDETRYIFDRIPAYISHSGTVEVISARTEGGRLVGFDVADFESRDYAFYMFNFRSRALYVPGVSDLLLHELIATAREKGKRFVNLGLGISEGNVFFKKKWGGDSFLPYEFCLSHLPEATRAQTLLQRLLGL